MSNTIINSSTVPYATNEVYDSDGDDEPGFLTWQWWINMLQGVQFDAMFYVSIGLCISGVALIAYYLVSRRQQRRLKGVPIGGGGPRCPPRFANRLV